MAKDDVLKALDQPENEPIETTLGPLLRQKLDQHGWEKIVLLQHLNQSSPNLAGWNGLFSRARLALADPNDLAAKGGQLLQNVNNDRFNDILDDFIAEMLGIVYLAESGHATIRFLSENGPITVDIQSESEGRTYFTEVKNLREPRTLSIVSFKRWNWNLETQRDKFGFRADFLDLDDSLSDLTSDQESSMNTLIDNLPNRKVPSEFVYTLPGDRKVRVRLSEGSPVMLRHGSGPFLVGPVVERARRGLLLKLMDPARKALSQLYRTEVPEDARRLLFVRWKLPEDIAAIGEAENVRVPVHEQALTLFQSFFSHFSLVIAHTQEDPKDVPKARWN
jgi:hypothetical protein